MKAASYWIEKLGLQKHPEGGWFKETYRSNETIKQSALPTNYNGNRNISTSIYYLLEGKDMSVFHRLKSDEIWHFYTGTSSIKITLISPEGKLTEHLIGTNPDYDEVFQFIIPKNHWFAAEPTNKSGYALVGCTVAPGFDFDDFEMAKREELIKQFPLHQECIKKLTRI